MKILEAGVIGSFPSSSLCKFRWLARKCISAAFLLHPDHISFVYTLFLKNNFSPQRKSGSFQRLATQIWHRIFFVTGNQCHFHGIQVLIRFNQGDKDPNEMIHLSRTTLNIPRESQVIRGNILCRAICTYRIWLLLLLTAAPGDALIAQYLLKMYLFKMECKGLGLLRGAWNKLFTACNYRIEGYIKSYQSRFQNRYSVLHPMVPSTRKINLVCRHVSRVGADKRVYSNHL